MGHVIKFSELAKALRTASAEFNRRLCKQCQNNITQQRRWFSTGPKLFGVWEPDGLDEPKFGKYTKIDIKMNGYDYVVLESFSKFMKSVSTTMDLDMKVVAIPPRTSSIKTFFENSTKVKENFSLKRYERKLRFDTILCTKFTIFLDVLRHNLPAGVDFELKSFSKEEEEFRFIPSEEKLSLLARLASLEKEKLERERRKDKF
ncbi:large ribosomal subunit protein mL48 [Magallana gigas]|uniref:large ribosomal subunit protein mL48 n=1 Tax=Magallana gigas TaxID=29159 RepID=UPI0005C356E0|eukprot:XP_011419434.1 PREDICTED: 39S ribosomal protein L48, mitochondrial-like [Crassostrea gigas]